MNKDVKNSSESSDEEVLDGSDIPDMGEIEEEDKLEEEEISDEQDEEEVDEEKPLPEKKSRYSDRVRELVQQRKDKENEVSELKKKIES